MARKAGVVYTIGWLSDVAESEEVLAGVRGLDETGITAFSVDATASGDEGTESVEWGVTGSVKAEALDSDLIAALLADNGKTGTLTIYDQTTGTPVAGHVYHGRLKAGAGPRAGHTDVVSLAFEVVPDTVPSHMSETVPT